MAEPEVTGTLTINILEARQLQAVEKTQSGFYVEVQIGDTAKEFTVRKDAENLQFHEQFVFNGANSIIPVQLVVHCHDRDGKDLKVGSAVIEKTKWNGETRWIMLENRRKAFAGEVLVSLSFDRAAVALRPPFSNVAKVAERTGNLVAPADAYIEQGLDFCTRALTALASSTYLARARKWGSKLERHHIAALVMANGSVLLSFLGTVAVCVTIPALLFFPITIFFSVTSAVFLAMTLMLLVPVASVVAWLLVCSHPVQRRFVRPALHKALDYPTVSRALIKAA